jgi:hypothetical protein
MVEIFVCEERNAVAPCEDGVSYESETVNI